VKYSKILIKSLILIFACQFVQAAQSAAKNTSKVNMASVGFLSQVKGDVFVNGKPASSGEKINLNSEISTGKNGQLKLLVGDGTVASVGYNTVLQVEKYSLTQNKKKIANKTIHNETVQFGLLKGSVRVMLNKDEHIVRLATVHAGDAFGVLQEGEAHFMCDSTCAAKIEALKKAPSKKSVKK
jgi:hypothetical protein